MTPEEKKQFEDSLAALDRQELENQDMVTESISAPMQDPSTTQVAAQEVPGAGSATSPLDRTAIEELLQRSRSLRSNQDGYGQQESMDALRAAQEKAQQDRGIAKSLNFGRMTMGVGPSSFLERESDRAGQEVTDLVARRNALGQEENLKKSRINTANENRTLTNELDLEETKKDLNSPYSIAYRTVIKNALGNNVPKNLDLEAMSAFQLEEMAPMLKGLAQKSAMSEYQQQSLNLRKQDMEFKKTGEARRSEDQDRRLSKDLYRVTQDYEKDDTIKALKKQDLGFSEAGNLLTLMESGNEIALGALGTKMARAMGEVGVLTDADVQRYIQSQSVPRKALDIFNKGYKGKLSDLTKEELKSVVDIMKLGFTKRASEVKEKYIDRAYTNFARPTGMSYEEVVERFEGPAKKDTPKAKEQASNKTEASNEAKPVTRKYAPGTTLKVKGVLYQVGNDGNSLEEIK